MSARCPRRMRCAASAGGTTSSVSASATRPSDTRPTSTYRPGLWLRSSSGMTWRREGSGDTDGLLAAGRLLAHGLVLHVLRELLELVVGVLLPLGARVAAQELLEVDARVAAVLERVEGDAVLVHRVGHDVGLGEVVDDLGEGADGVGVAR